MVIKNQNGMGILEVTIAAALGIMVIGGIYTALDNINRTVNMSQVRLDAITLQDEMRLIFSKPENCLATFTGKKFVYTGGGGTPWVSATNITSDSGDTQRTSQIKSTQGTTVITEYDVDNANLKAGTSKLYRILLDQYTPSTAPTSATDANFFSGTARLTFTLQAKSSALSSTVKSKPFLLNVNLMRCSGCPTAGANCESDCGGLATNDMKIKSCSTQPNTSATVSASAGSENKLYIHNCEMIRNSSTADNVDHAVNCPANKAAIEVSAFSTGYLDWRLTLVCCNVGNLVWGTENTVSSGKDYTYNYQEHAAFCPADKFMTGISVHATAQFDGSLAVKCNNFPGLSLNKTIFGATTNSYTHLTFGSKDWDEHAGTCKDSVLSGVGFYSADRFDNITRIECSE